MIPISLGGVLASASSITPTHNMHHISGSTNINTIVPPNPEFCGIVLLVTDDANLSYTTSGNITRLIGSTIGVAYMFVYDPGIQKWRPVSL